MQIILLFISIYICSLSLRTHQYGEIFDKHWYGSYLCKNPEALCARCFPDGTEEPPVSPPISGSCAESHTDSLHLCTDQPSPTGPSPHPNRGTCQPPRACASMSAQEAPEQLDREKQAESRRYDSQKEQPEQEGQGAAENSAANAWFARGAQDSCAFRHVYMSPALLVALRERTRSVFYFAYDNYMRHAFPFDELDPIHCTGRGHDHQNPYSLTLFIYSAKTSI